MQACGKLPESPECLEGFPAGHGPSGVRVYGGDGAPLAELGLQQQLYTDPHQPLTIVLLKPEVVWISGASKEEKVDEDRQSDTVMA